MNEADILLMQFCKTFQELYNNYYGDKKCTPNMHLHCHLHQTILDYGPAHSSWCFAFERFNSIFESFQKNWIHPEVQLMAKFLRFQDMATLDIPFEIPHELTDIFQAHSLKVREIVHGQGSLLATHIDSLLHTWKIFLAPWIKLMHLKRSFIVHWVENMRNCFLQKRFSG